MGLLLLEKICQGVKLTTHILLVPRLRKRGSLPLLPQYVFMARCLPGAEIAQWCSAGLRARLSGVRVPAEARNFSLHHPVQTGSWSYPASYPWVPGAPYSGRPDRESGHHLRLVPRSRICGAIPLLPNTSS
jgi:hypothetical protein